MDNLGSYFRRDESGRTHQRVEAKLDPLMLVLSVLFVLVYVIPTLVDISPEADAWLATSGWIIWIVFVVEYVWLLALAPKRWSWVRTHKLDLMIIALPFLRPMRFTRAIRVATTTPAIGRALIGLRRIGSRPGFQPFFGIVLLFILVSAGFALVFEHDQPGASIDSFGTALWWAIVTCSTVGYGDHFPVTTGGRVVAVSLMIIGIAGLSLLTASVAAMFVDQDEESDTADLQARLVRIEALLLAMGEANKNEFPSTSGVKVGANVEMTLD